MNLIALASDSSAPLSTPTQATSDLTLIAGKSSDLQPSASPSSFSALLLLLFPGMAPAGSSIAQPADSGVKPNSRSGPGPKKIQDQNPNVGIAAGLVFGSVVISVAEAQVADPGQSPSLETAGQSSADSPPLSMQTNVETAIPSPAPSKNAPVIGPGFSPTPGNGSIDTTMAGYAAAKPSQGIAENRHVLSATNDLARSSESEAPAPPLGSQDAKPVLPRPPAEISAMADLAAFSTVDADTPDTTVTASTTDKDSGEQKDALEGTKLSAPTASGAERPRLDAIAHSEPVQGAPSPAEQVQNQVAVHLDQLRQMGHAEVQLDLHPPELGRVQLHLTMDDGHVNVHMIVQDEGVKRMMDQQLEPLRVRFSEMGVSVGQFDVRRDGGSPNQNQQASSEPSLQAIQTDKNGALRPRKPYAQVADPLALVDVIV
jgi:flagellar hook-length control protein FliK